MELISYGYREPLIFLEGKWAWVQRQEKVSKENIFAASEIPISTFLFNML